MNLEELMASTPPMQQHALIKGFQAGAASRDAEIQRLQFALADAEALEIGTAEQCDALQADRDEWKARAEFSYRQRDELNRLCEFNEKTMSALQADNARLRESTELLLIARQIGHYRDEWDMLKEALAATPEQSLAEYRNKVIEDHAEIVRVELDNNGQAKAIIRAMKEQP